MNNYIYTCIPDYVSGFVQLVWPKSYIMSTVPLDYINRSTRQNMTQKKCKHTAGNL